MSLNTKMRIVLKGYDCKALDLAVTQLISLAKQRKVTFAGPIPLPVERQLYTVNRSPHIDKTSREQFERKTHKRLLCIEDNGGASGFLSSLAQISVPAGVGISLKYNPNVKKNVSTVIKDKS